MATALDFTPFDDKAATVPHDVDLSALGWPAFYRQALSYQPDQELREMLWAAWSLQRPLLLRGRPGSGKSTAAYWAALKLAAHFAEDPTQDLVQHAQIRSASAAQELKYNFDHLARLRDANRESDVGLAKYIHPGPLWFAFDRYSLRSRYVVLLDELDKAPRDLPNDLLYEFDKYEFEVPELGEQTTKRVGVDRVGVPSYKSVGVPWPSKQSLFILTSNDERELPPAFMRRCLHHEIKLDEERIGKILSSKFAALQKLVEVVSALGKFLKKHADIDVMPMDRRIEWLRLREVSSQTEVGAELRALLCPPADAKRSTDTPPADTKKSTDTPPADVRKSTDMPDVGKVCAAVLELPQHPILLSAEGLTWVQQSSPKRP